MGLFDIFRKKQTAPPPPAPSGTGPYEDEAINQAYQLLFSDDLKEVRSTTQPPYSHPYFILFSDSADLTSLRRMVADESLEARLRLLAARRLRAEGQPSVGKELLGVVVEMGLEEGLDVLAAYKDGSARYISHDGSLLVLEAPDKMTEYLTGELFEKGRSVIGQIGPWEGARRPFPKTGYVRLSFLVSDGLYFGEGPIQGLFNDPLSGPVLNVATQLLQYLTEQAGEGEKNK